MPAPDIKPFTVVTGHFGAGKTNLCLNLALDLAERYDAVTVVDLDIVNPYFRLSDYTDLLAAKNVRLIAPVFAGATVDAPSLSAEIYSAFEAPGAVIFDVGGDDAGATALGRFQRDIGQIDHDMLYVVNRYRDLTATPTEAVRLLKEIEGASRLSATGVVNNSHLKQETTAETVLGSVGFACETARVLGLPLVCTTVPEGLLGVLPEGPVPVPFGSGPTAPASAQARYVQNAYHIKTYVRTQWEDPEWEGP